MSICWDIVSASAEQRVDRMVSRMVPSVWEGSAMLMSVCWEDGCSGEESVKGENESDVKE
jgi:hypothetical protein